MTWYWLAGVIAEVSSSTWLTSEFRLLVSVPTDPCRSSRSVDVPSRSASLRAIARPTAPAPMTYIRGALVSILSYHLSSLRAKMFYHMREVSASC